MSTTAVSASEPTTIEKISALPWSIAGDSFNTVFVQFTFFGSVFILFLDALGMSKSQIGILLSLFPFAGLIALVIAPSVARFGFKRTFLTFWTLRKLVTLLLLLTPLVLASFGETAAVVYVGIIVAAFALCRATAETGKYPWTQEYVPNQIRGKYTAVDNVFTTLIGIAAVAAAGYTIANSSDLAGFTLLIGVGVVVGLLGVWAYSHVPGGAAIADKAKAGQRDLRSALNDRSFRNYLLGIGLMTLATIPMISFLPLFMVEEVSLRDSQVILLQNGVLIGGLLSVFVWGWLADRFGSTPVLISGVLLRILLPILWLFMPREAPWNLYAAMGIAVLQGVANMGWAIGSARLLFVRVVPPEKKSDYMALYYAWIGVVGGLSQLLGGWILQNSQGLSYELPFLALDPYSPLFLIGLVLPLVSLFFFRGVDRDSRVSMGTFAGFLFRGNPFMAVESMVRYHIAKDEETTVRVTEKLGQAKSLLAVEELLSALDDPRFNVRFEAIIAISRTPVDAELITALEQLLYGSDPALSAMAAWALGRMQDDQARDTLRTALDADYRSVRAHSARSLGSLGDESVAPDLLRRLEAEPDHGLKVAYASTLGKLQAKEATAPLLTLLAAEDDETTRLELGLALARLIDEEAAYVHLVRQIRADPGTIVAQELLALDKQRQKAETIKPNPMLHEGAILLGNNKIPAGLKRFGKYIETLLPDQPASVSAEILSTCTPVLLRGGDGRLEYAILALLALAPE